MSRLWKSLLHYVPISRLHGHSSTLDAVCHVNICYTEHCYFIYMYHHYTVIVIHDTIISYSCPIDIRIHYFTGYHDFIYLYHRYMDTLYTVISCSYTIAIWIHRYTCVDCFYIPVAWTTIHITWIITQ